MGLCGASAEPPPEPELLQEKPIKEWYNRPWEPMPLSHQKVIHYYLGTSPSYNAWYGSHSFFQTTISLFTALGALTQLTSVGPIKYYFDGCNLANESMVTFPWYNATTQVPVDYNRTDTIPLSGCTSCFSGNTVDAIVPKFNLFFLVPIFGILAGEGWEDRVVGGWERDANVAGLEKRIEQSTWPCLTHPASAPTLAQRSTSTRTSPCRSSWTASPTTQWAQASTPLTCAPGTCGGGTACP